MNVSKIIHFGRIVTVLAWAAFLVFAWTTGRLMLIHPSYRWLSLAAAGVLAAVGLALMFDRGHGQGAREHDHDHDGDDDGAEPHAHEHGPECGCGEACHGPAGKTEIAFQCIALVPIVASLLLGRGGLSTQAMVTRGVRMMPAAQEPAAVPAKTPPATTVTVASVPAAVVPPAAVTTTTEANPFAAMEDALPPMTLSDIHFAMLMGRRGDLEGRQAEVLGQYFVDDRCGPGEFCVVRIVVTCCLADAEVMGMLVKPKKPYTPGSSKAASDAAEKLRLPNEPGALELKMRLQEQGPWIEVTGKLKAVKDRRGQMIYCITDAVAKDVEPPAEILMYPKPMTGW